MLMGPDNFGQTVIGPAMFLSYWVPGQSSQGMCKPREKKTELGQPQGRTWM